MPEAIQFYNGASTLLEYYPENNRLKSVTTNANDLVQEIRYTVYDKNGNVKNIEDGSDPDQAVKTFAYGYDGLNRLRSADSSAYGSLNPIGLDYAGVGNIWKNTVTGTETFPAERRLVYDSDNRLSAIETDSGLTTFVYNYQGERVIKQNGDSTTIYIGGLFEEKGATKIKHIFAGDRRIVTRIGSITYYYHPDHLGGLSVVTNSAGDVAQKARYYPFGQQINPGAETDLLPYRFTGQELDTETGLYYYKSRYYDPMIGRFISPDPLIQAAFDPPTFPRLIGFEYGGKEAPINANAEKEFDLAKVIGSYVYVGNNPGNMIDPLGLVKWRSVLGGAGGMVGGYFMTKAGILMSTTGLGAVFGVPLITTGVACSPTPVSLTTVVATGNIETADKADTFTKMLLFGYNTIAMAQSVPTFGQSVSSAVSFINLGNKLSTYNIESQTSVKEADKFSPVFNHEVSKYLDTYSSHKLNYLQFSNYE